LNLEIYISRSHCAFSLNLKHVSQKTFSRLNFLCFIQNTVCVTDKLTCIQTHIFVQHLMLVQHKYCHKRWRPDIKPFQYVIMHTVINMDMTNWYTSTIFLDSTIFQSIYNFLMWSPRNCSQMFKALQHNYIFPSKQMSFLWNELPRTCISFDAPIRPLSIEHIIKTQYIKH
jgi:hypothetical protein